MGSGQRRGGIAVSLRPSFGFSRSVLDCTECGTRRVKEKFALSFLNDSRIELHLSVQTFSLV